MLSRTPFAITTPRSSPIRKLMKTSTRKPTIVVNALPAIEENEPSRAAFIALSRSEGESCSFLAAIAAASCRYLLIRITE